MIPATAFVTFVSRKAVWGARAAALAALLAAVSGAGCGEVATKGTGNSFLIINSLEGASGAEPTDFGGTLWSDVQTIVDDAPTVFADNGRVSFRLALKNPGSPTSPNSPSQFDLITVERYHVTFIRADGRNTPGVDVPYPFDGAITATVDEGETIVTFELVRHLAKGEAPLRALIFNGVIISTIAEVTFYGRDVAGRAVSATARISANFGNFGDPE